VTDHEPLLSRRALLAAGVGGVALVTGCTSHPAKPPADPDRAAIETARLTERTLLETYAEGTAGHTVHLTHLRALGDTGATPSPDRLPSGGSVPPERATVAPLMEAARNARRGRTAALLASIAASHDVLSDVRPR
jgi:hypothetical protein